MVDRFGRNTEGWRNVAEENMSFQFSQRDYTAGYN